MILDMLDNSARYSGLLYNLPAALKYLQVTDLRSLPLGRVDIDGDNLFALPQEYTTKLFEQGVWEAHRNYIDIHYMDTGQESIGFANLSTMQLGDYVPEKDFQPMNGSGNYLQLSNGLFVIFFPEDGHMPGLCITAPEHVRKIVLKVKMN